MSPQEFLVHALKVTKMVKEIELQSLKDIGSHYQEPDFIQERKLSLEIQKLEQLYHQELAKL